MSNQSRVKGFTLAEVLITLAIIGVVAALTIPSVIASYKDKQYNTARLKALKTFGEAGKMASINDEMNSQTNATDFVNNVLSKYLKITKVCTLANSEDCGFPSQIQPSNPDPTLEKNTVDLKKWNQIGRCSNTRISSPTNNTGMSIVIATNDGFSALVHYNPKCVRNSHEATGGNCTFKECPLYNVDATCVNVIYDMNGLKVPNHVGEDIGIVTVFWSGLKTIAVAPGIIPYFVNTTGITEATFTNAPNVCAQKGTKKVSYTMPNIDEISSLYMNQQLTSVSNDIFWSGSLVFDRPGVAWDVSSHGDRANYGIASTFKVWCVRR